MIFFVVVASVAGCGNAAVKAPTGPAPGSVAMITLPVSSAKWQSGIVQLAISSKHGCGEFSKNVLPDTYDKDVTLPIEGDRDIFFHILRSEVQNDCNIFGMFYGSKGKEYILNVEKNGDLCEISLIEKSPVGKGRQINTYPSHASKINGVKVCTSKEKL